jgi:hypothetical protein
MWRSAACSRKRLNPSEYCEWRAPRVRLRQHWPSGLMASRSRSERVGLAFGLSRRSAHVGGSADRRWISRRPSPGRARRVADGCWAARGAGRRRVQRFDTASADGVVTGLLDVVETSRRSQSPRGSLPEYCPDARHPTAARLVGLERPYRACGRPRPFKKSPPASRRASVGVVGTCVHSQPAQGFFVRGLASLRVPASGLAHLRRRACPHSAVCEGLRFSIQRADTVLCVARVHPGSVVGGVCTARRFDERRRSSPCMPRRALVSQTLNRSRNGPVHTLHNPPGHHARHRSVRFQRRHARAT